MFHSLKQLLNHWSQHFSGLYQQNEPLMFKRNFHQHSNNLILSLVLLQEVCNFNFSFFTLKKKNKELFLYFIFIPVVAYAEAMDLSATLSVLYLDGFEFDSETIQPLRNLFKQLINIEIPKFSSSKKTSFNKANLYM